MVAIITPNKSLKEFVNNIQVKILNEIKIIKRSHKKTKITIRLSSQQAS